MYSGKYKGESIFPSLGKLPRSQVTSFHKMTNKVNFEMGTKINVLYINKITNLD
ncbi:hypothetical protein QJS04_geneDACA016144 [Acorus gramineus]|uniref:Uncharacterized protein n=1 Tax=Acorus gramineus TaxID=55184 RepID=A0AAV9ALZ3_ACOGR|nr:hypothetical protein QJS04_geneDACA016144 [Acorus gramineus]